MLGCWSFCDSLDTNLIQWFGGFGSFQCGDRTYIVFTLYLNIKGFSYDQDHRCLQPVVRQPKINTKKRDVYWGVWQRVRLTML